MPDRCDWSRLAEVNGPKVDVEVVLVEAVGSGDNGHGGLLICNRALGCSSVPAQLVEEVVDDVQFAGAGHLVVDVFADREVEHAEAEG